MAAHKELGAHAVGRIVDNEFRLTRPARTVAGTVVGLYPLDPKHVQVAVGTGSGNVHTIRIK